MKEFGFVRVGAISNRLFLADPIKNAEELTKMIKKASEKNIQIVTTPELSITGYTCGDLFLQRTLEQKALEALEYILEKTKDLSIISIIGMPLRSDNQLFNVAVVIEKGKILGIVPKTYIPNYEEFYEKRWFSSSKDLISHEISILGYNVPFSTNLLFTDKANKDITFAVEICEDLWTVTPPSNNHTLNGATIIFNLSSSNEIVGKHQYRKNLVSMQSAKTISAYIYTSSGIMESSSDLVFSGTSLIYENGSKLKENERFSLDSTLIYSDIDVEQLINDRIKNKSYTTIENKETYLKIEIDIEDNKKYSLDRIYSKYPFLPSEDEKRKERCNEIINIQANALARRLIQLNYPKCVIGISGGLDSTLAFLVIIKAYKKLKLENKNIISITMPGFGTTDRTYQNACKLVREYGATLKEIDIKNACAVHLRDIGISLDDRSVTYENAQARERTQILMDVANKENAIVIGTGDLSELALGWCTYNGDHMSMYAVNSSIPKTLVKYLVKNVADLSSSRKQKILYDILNTTVSPELLPPDEKGNISQKTESSIGPYVLHDFYLYYFLRHKMSFKKIYFLACKTFENDYSNKEIKKWLKVFIKRFFVSQFKRNCVPDGIKVGSVSLSPRGDLRLPSDASYDAFLNEIEDLK